MGYVGGESRQQATLFPVALDDLVAEDHAVRVIDAFAERLDLLALGFAKAAPAATGRPPYDPADLLKLYLYGLLNRLAPDHKTIAEFRRQNGAPFKAVCRAFVGFCAEAKLIGGQWVAIDGSKFQAVASKRAVVSRLKLEEQLKAIDADVQTYLEALDSADGMEEQAHCDDRQAVREALSRLQQRRADLLSTAAILKGLEQSHHVMGEPEARLMKTGEGSAKVAYNVQTAVDAKHKLVVHHEVNNHSNDERSLLPMALGAKQALGSETLNVVADGGYSNGEHAKACEDAGITPHVPVQRAVNNKDGGIYFERSQFVYDKRSDTYRCPAGDVLRRRRASTRDRLVHYTTKACAGCRLKPQCTGARQRLVTRHFYEDALERLRERVEANPAVMALRRESAEHPFANLKHRIMGNGRLLMRGIRGASAEMALAVLAYNFRRALNLLGSHSMIQRLTSQPAS